MANLPGEATYTNNTSNAQIQISPFEYNLGAPGGSERAVERRRKEEGPRGEEEESREQREREGERESLPISQLTQTNGTI